MTEEREAENQALHRARRLAKSRLKKMRALRDELALFKTLESGALKRAHSAEARLRVEEQRSADLLEALAKARDEEATGAAAWRLRAEEAEEKLKTEAERQSLIWSQSVDMWRGRFEAAQRQLLRHETQADRERDWCAP